MTTVLISPASLEKSNPIDLNFHLVTTLSIQAKEARKLVNHKIVPELGTGLVANEPELFINEDQIAWRVPIKLSLPTLGDLGFVGSVIVNARTGEMLLTEEDRERIVNHARRLYKGATLSAE